MARGSKVRDMLFALEAELQNRPGMRETAAGALVIVSVQHARDTGMVVGTRVQSVRRGRGRGLSSSN